MWIRERDIPFLREERKDQAEITKTKMLTIEAGVRAGYKPDALVEFAETDDVTGLKGQHTGLTSVQLLPPGEKEMTPTDFGALRDEPVRALAWVDEDEIVSRALADAIDELSRDRYDVRIPGGNVHGGRFRKLSDTIFEKLKEWLAGDGEDDPLAEYSKEQLRRVAKERGLLKPRERVSEDQLKLRLYKDIRERGGKRAPDGDSERPEPAKKAPPEAAPAKKAAPKARFDPAEVAARVSDQPSQAAIVQLLAGDPTLTSAKLRKVAGELDIDVPDGMRAKSALQLHIAEKVARDRDLPSGFDAPPAKKVAKKAAPEAGTLPAKSAELPSGSDIEVAKSTKELTDVQVVRGEYLTPAGRRALDALGPAGHPRIAAIPDTEGKVREAYRMLAIPGSGNDHHVALADVRKLIGDQVPRADLDETLLRMARGPDTRLVPQSYARGNAATRIPAAVMIGGQEQNQLHIDDPTLARPSEFPAVVMAKELINRRSGRSGDPMMALISDADLQAEVDRRASRDPVVARDLAALPGWPPERTPAKKAAPEKAESLLWGDVSGFEALAEGAKADRPKKPDRPSVRTPEQIAADDADLAKKRREVAEQAAAAKKDQAEITKQSKTGTAPTQHGRLLAPDPEQKARDRQSKIDTARGVADTLAELDQITDSEASATAVQSRLRSTGKRNNLPAGVVDDLIAAAGDRKSRDAAVARLAGEHGLVPGSRAGTVEAFDPAKHQMMGGGSPGGTHVRVVRPGYEADVDGERVRLSKATVSDAPSPTPSARANPKIPRYTPSADTDTAAADTLRDQLRLPDPAGHSLHSAARQVEPGLRSPEADRLVERLGQPTADRIAREADVENGFAGFVQSQRPDDPNLGEFDDLPPVTPDEMAAAQSRAERALRQDLAGKKIAVRMTPEGVAAMARDGQIKTLFDTGRSGGLGGSSASYKRKRRDREQMLFGIPNDAPPADRPIYGYVAVDGIQTPQEHGFLAQYGDVQIVLKDRVRGRTTASVGDSIDDDTIPSPVDNPTWQSFNGPAHSGGGGYRLKPDSIWIVEAQIHGGVTADDIDEVVFSSTPDAKLTGQLKAAGIRYRVSGDDATLDVPGTPKPEADVAATRERIRQLRRQVEVENRIRAAYKKLAKPKTGREGQHGWVDFLRLRTAVGSDVSREEFDATVKRLDREGAAISVPEENRKAVTQADIDAGVRFGTARNESNTIAFIDDPEPRPVPDARTAMAAILSADFATLTNRQKRARLRKLGFSAEQIDELAPLASAKKAAPSRTPTRPPATPVPARDLLAADDATISTALRDVYEGQFGPYTTKVDVSIRRAGKRVDKRGREHDVELSISVEGKVYDEQGTEIGFFSRSIGPTDLHYGDTVRREVWAEHHTVQLGGGDYDENPTKYHGKGFGGEFNRRAIEWYRASGVHGITQNDHNGYVWASQGFDFRGGVVPEYKAEELRNLVADLRAGKAKSSIGETIPKRLRDAPNLAAQLDAAEELLARLESTRPGQPGYPTAYEMSQLGRRGGQRGKTALWLGKHLGVSADEMILNPDEGEVISQ
jgi:hypothetical protein